MKKCIIIGAGDFTLSECICKEDFVIAADGGYDHAKTTGIEPNLFVVIWTPLPLLCPRT